MFEEDACYDSQSGRNANWCIVTFMDHKTGTFRKLTTWETLVGSKEKII